MKKLHEELWDLTIDGAKIFIHMLGKSPYEPKYNVIEISFDREKDLKTVEQIVREHNACFGFTDEEIEKLPWHREFLVQKMRYYAGDADAKIACLERIRKRQDMERPNFWGADILWLIEEVDRLMAEAAASKEMIKR